MESIHIPMSSERLQKIVKAQQLAKLDMATASVQKPFTSAVESFVNPHKLVGMERKSQKQTQQQDQKQKQQKQQQQYIQHSSNAVPTPSTAKSSRTIHTEFSQVTPTYRVTNTNRSNTTAVDLYALRAENQRVPEIIDSQYKRSVPSKAKKHSMGRDEKQRSSIRQQSAVDVDQSRIGRICQPNISNHDAAFNPLSSQPVIRMRKMVLDVIDALQLEAEKIRKIPQYTKKVVAMQKLSVTQRGILKAIVEYAQKSQKAGHEGAVIRHEMAAIISQLTAVFTNMQTELDEDIIKLGKPAVIGRPTINRSLFDENVEPADPSQQHQQPHIQSIPTADSHQSERIRHPGSRTPGPERNQTYSEKSKYSVGVVTSPISNFNAKDNPTVKSGSHLTQIQHSDVILRPNRHLLVGPQNRNHRKAVVLHIDKLTDDIVNEVLRETVGLLSELETSDDHISIRPNLKWNDDPMERPTAIDAVMAYDVLEEEIRQKYSIPKGKDRLKTDEELETGVEAIQVTRNPPKKKYEKYGQPQPVPIQDNQDTSATEDIIPPGFVIDTLDDDLIDLIFDNRDRYERHIKMVMGIDENLSSLSDPWVLMDVLSEDLLDEVLGNTSADLFNMCDSYVDRMIDTENVFTPK
eukprot:TRINITY_DN9976_c0_g1_i1.p1 TRINITY_DN9976_c0_g1~~TRINITY_DN9976_c0_g1_i1.p1  ORF type:complete len:633 (+),score=144.58 TRINITY_DN9976_c0_g1_i1:43-1941(+)